METPFIVPVNFETKVTFFIGAGITSCFTHEKQANSVKVKINNFLDFIVIQLI